MQDQFDPQVAALSKAIFQHESGNDFNAVGDAGTSHGAGQWQAGTWKEHAKMVLGDENAQMTPENQKAVIYGVIKKDKADGLNPAQIAAKWNSGSPNGWENKIGTTTINGQQIKYNVPQYVKGVTDLYQQNKSQYDQQPSQSVQTPQVEPEKPNFFTPMDQHAEELTNSNSLADKALGYWGKASLGAAKLVGADKPISYIGEKLEDALGYQGRPENYQTTTGRQALAGTAETALNFAGGAEIKGLGAALKTGKGLLPQVAKGLASGYAYDVASKNAEGETGAESFTPGVGTALLGTLPVLGKGAGLIKNLVKPSTEKIVANNLQGINELVSKYSPLQKVIAKAESQGHDVKKILSESDLLHGAVDNTGHIDTRDAIGQLNDFIKPYEGVITEALAKEGRTIPLTRVEAELRNAINNAGLEGASLETAHNKIDAAIKGLSRRIDEQGNISIAKIHDAKVNAYGTINYMNEGEKLADKAIARTYKNLVEQNSSAPIRELNKELAGHYNVLNFLEKLNNKKVEGGKLGKYFAQTAGNIIGSHFGPLGSIVGGELASRMKGAQMATNFARKTGKKMEASGLMQQTIRDNKIPKKPLLQLPAPAIKQGGENFRGQKIDVNGKVISPKSEVKVTDATKKTLGNSTDNDLEQLIKTDPYSGDKQIDEYLTGRYKKQTDEKSLVKEALTQKETSKEVLESSNKTKKLIEGEMKKYKNVEDFIWAMKALDWRKKLSEKDFEIFKEEAKKQMGEAGGPEAYLRKIWETSHQSNKQVANAFAGLPAGMTTDEDGNIQFDPTRAAVGAFAGAVYSNKRFESLLKQALKEVKFKVEDLVNLKAYVKELKNVPGQNNVSVRQILTKGVNTIAKRSDEKLNAETYNKLLTDWKNGDLRPAEYAKLPGGKIWIEDGNHRLTAAKVLGLEEYPAIDVTSKFSQKDLERLALENK